MGDLYLVTGGAGFIGSHVVAELLSRGHAVRILDNFSTGRRGNLTAVDGDVEVFEGDMRSYERAHNAVKGVDLVIHLAALPSVPRSVQDPLTTNEANVTGTLNVLLAARDNDARRVVAGVVVVYPSARALRSHRTGSIAITIPELTNPYFAAVAEGVQHVAARANFKLSCVTRGPMREPSPIICRCCPTAR